MSIEMIDEVGSTALIVAAYRAEEEHRDAPLFVDSYAKLFIDDEMVQRANDFHAALPESKDAIRYRIKYFDDLIAKRIESGVSQVVLLGGGFDVRACKYSDKDVRFFDVDQPPVISYKRKVLEENAIEYPSTGVPCNYLSDDFLPKLREAGFDDSLPTLFIWEGNTFYLPEQDVFHLLQTLRDGISHFEIAFDFISKKIVEKKTGIRSLTELIDFFAGLSSPWITGFDDVEIFKEKVGLDIYDHYLTSKLAEQYERNDKKSMSKILGHYTFCSLGNA